MSDTKTEWQFTYAELYAIAKREVGQREYVYPRHVASGSKTQREATRQIEGMRAIAKHFERLMCSERLI